MSRPAADEPAGTTAGVRGSVGPRRGGAPAAAAAGAAGASPPADRAQTSADAGARDWADTGAPDHEPALPDGPDGPDDPDDSDGLDGLDGPGDSDDSDGSDGSDGPASDPAAPADPATPASDPATPASDPATPASDPATPASDPATPAPAPAAPASGAAAPAPAPAAPASALSAVEDPGAVGGGADGLASGGDPAPAEPPRQVVRATGPARRPPLIVQGLWPALLAGALAAAATFGLLPLAVAVLGVQVFLVLGALALLDAPAAGGAFVVATFTAATADALVLLDDGKVTGLAGAAGLGLVASLVHQLSRKGRSRVTESLADTLVVIVVAVAAACLLALEQMRGGEQVLLVSLAATGAVLLAGRLGDWVVPRPVLAVGATRGWPGLVLGLGAGVACGVLVADTGGELPLRSAALLGLVVAATVATADLAVDLGAAELRSGWRDARRVAALRPTALLLPYAVLGPVALLAGRLVLT